MKSKVFIVVAISFITVLGSCTGNHTAKNPPDTNGNVVDTVKSVDTSKTTTTTGSVPNVDNSGAGGTKIDTPQTK
ncbi:hypothetical protein [Mucilaginibacter antarcticus]|uniref:Uncharacterized protein n=1 Tax=Mucilaginibacter antarcticus TaxID=1855725 RepID=A0ABW5XS52_9SPHI